MSLRVSVVGSGKWGTAVAKLIAENVKKSAEFEQKINLYVYESVFNGEKLSDIINRDHVNPKHLPSIKLPENIVAITCPKKVVQDADIIVFVLRQQFLGKVCDELKGFIKEGAIGISLTKSLYHEVDKNQSELKCASDIIKERLGMQVSVLMGPNLADEIAKGKFSETTIACTNQSLNPMWSKLFSSDYFVVRFWDRIKEVELCGALKNIVAAAAGISDGLGLGENAKAAIIRLGFQEMKMFIHFILKDDVNDEVFWEPCGFPDLVATCYGGITRKVVEEFAKSNKTLKEVEADHFGGMVLEGPENVKQAFNWIKSENRSIDKFRLLTAVHGVFHEGEPPQSFIEALKTSF